MTVRAIIYCRVSSDPNGRGKSVAEQERECRTIAAREGWDVAEVLTDNDVGASRYSRGDRQAYARLDTILSPGDVLVTWEASRAQRDLRAYLDLRDLCTRRGVLWCYSGRTHDLSRGDDRFATGLDALLAEKEVEQTRERIMRSMRANREAGRPHGKLAYGYRIVRDPDSGESLGRVPHPETAPRVQEIVRRILAGDSIYGICRDFNERGIQTPRPKRDGTPAQWIPQTIHSIAKNPTYAALRTHLGKVVGEGVWEPLITVDEHERVVAIITDPARKTGTSRGGEPRHLLSGIATCGHCGRPMTRQKNRGHVSYICNGSLPLVARDGSIGDTRFCVARVIHRVDPYVTEAVIRRLEGQELVRDFADTDTDYAALVDEARRLRRRLDEFADAAADGELTPTALARIEAKLLPQIEAAEQRARSLVASPLIASMMGAGARQRWAALELRDRRALIKTLVDVKIWRIGEGRRKYPDGEGIELIWK